MDSAKLDASITETNKKMDKIAEANTETKEELAKILALVTKLQPIGQ